MSSVPHCCSHNHMTALLCMTLQGLVPAPSATFSSGCSSPLPRDHQFCPLAMSHSRTPSACSSHSWQSNTHYFPAVALQKLSTFGKASIFDCWVWRPGIVFLKIVVFEILRSPRFEENASPPC